MSSPPPIDAHIAFVYTTDGPTAWRFYAETLRLPLVLDQGGCRIYRAAGGYLGVCQREDPRPPEGVILTLVSDDVDGWARHLEAAGAPLVVPPRHNPEYGIYQLFTRDPSGYLIEIQRFDDPDWAGAARVEAPPA